MTGLACLENRIYVVCSESPKVHIYSDQKQVGDSKDEEIEIKEMNSPQDMAASKESRSLFISDLDNRCLWRIRMPWKETSRLETQGRPRGLSINAADELLAVVESGDDRFYFDIYSSPDVARLRYIPLANEINDVRHAVQTSTGNFIVSHQKRSVGDVYLISELSSDGKQFIRTFDLRSIKSIQFLNWLPSHLSIGDGDVVFLADCSDGNRVLQMDSRWMTVQVLLNKDQHQIDLPSRIIHHREKRQLIVGHCGKSLLSFRPAIVSVFNLTSSRR